MTKRLFSSNLPVTTDKTALRHAGSSNPEVDQKITHSQLSRFSQDLEAKYAVDNREYLDMLNDTAARQRYFTNLA